MKIFPLQIAWKGWLAQKQMLPFSPDVKIIPAYFYFFSFQGFFERISCEHNPEVWT